MEEDVTSPLRGKETLTARHSKCGRWPQYTAVFLASLGAISVGLVGGWTSYALPLLRASWNLSEDQVSWLGSLPALGALVGALPAGLLADCCGRKRLLLALTLPFTAGWICVYAAAGRVWLLYCGRVLSGLAMGAATVVGPLYAEECCDVSVRGRLGITQNLLIDSGIVTAYCLGAAGQPLTVQTLAPCAAPLLQVVALPWAPESPVYLATVRGRRREAILATRQLRLEVDPLQRLQREQAARGFRAVPKRRVRCRALFIILGLMVTRQLVGINAFIYYTMDIFQQAGSSLTPSLATLVVGLVLLLSTMASAALVDHVGRRPLLLVSGSASAVSHAALAASTAGVGGGWLPLAAVVVFFAAFSLGFGSITWFVAAEVAPDVDRGWVSGLAAATNWTLMFSVTKVFPSSLTMLGRFWTFSLLSLLCILSTLFVMLFVPETRGKPRDLIQRELLYSSIIIGRGNNEHYEEDEDRIRPMVSQVATTEN